MSCYAEFSINDDETLQDSFRTLDEHCDDVVISRVEMYVRSEAINRTDVPQTTANTRPSRGFSELFYHNMFRTKESDLM